MRTARFTMMAICLLAVRLSAQPLKTMDLRDSTGKLVGQLVDTEERPAVVRYVLAGGDTVLLEATPYMLRPATTAFSYLFFFQSSDCTGAEAFWPVSSSSLQLTKRQAVIVNRTTAPSPVPVSSILYVSDRFPALVSAPGPVMSYFDTGSRTCTVPSDPDRGELAPFIRVVQTEDLAAKFTPPYWAQ